MKIYYNENDPKMAAWLRELIAQGQIAPGDVDDRSIKDVKGTDLTGYDQCHFFAGIGGWSLALELAGWSAGPVWTGSCPCQPFSAAGKHKGEKDERHLWPEFFRLIAECRPPTIFGEQVASKDGREWLAGVRADLESVAYAVGGADLCAAGVGAPHIRQRLYWVADAEHTERRSQRKIDAQSYRRDGLGRGGDAGGVGDADDTRSQGRRERSVEHSDQRFVEPSGVAGGVGDAEGEQVRGAGQSRALRDARPWSSFDILQCTDGKARRIEPGSFPLAHGIPARVGRLRGYGNAIVPQVAAEFIRAYLDV